LVGVLGSRRILVIGCPGTGKTTLARELARITGLPHFCLDDLYWGPGWRRPEEPDFARVLNEVLRRDRGIIDGNYYRHLAGRVVWAEAVIYLDYPAREAVSGLLRRQMARLLGDTASLPVRVRGGGGRNEPPFRHLLGLALTFRNRLRPLMLEGLRGLDDARLLILYRRAEAAQFLEEAVRVMAGKGAGTRPNPTAPRAGREETADRLEGAR
jgi:hypothetical protein